MVARRLLIITGLIGVAIIVAACDRVEAYERTPSRTLLDVPYIHQGVLLCVPTSAAMVLAFYGEKQDPRRLKMLADGQDFTPSQPFTDHSITYYRDLITGLHRIGYSWDEETLPDDPAGFSMGLQMIEHQLAGGHPVLVDATLPSGHTFVIRGFDHDKRELYIVDPSALFAPGRKTITYDWFSSVWNEHAYGGHTRGMIITQPK